MNGLEVQLDQLRLGVGAVSAALLVYAGDAGDREIGLFQSGSPQAAGDADSENPAGSTQIPELSSLEAADSLISGSLNSRRSELFTSRDPDCQLISIPVRPLELAPNQERRQFTPQDPSYWLGLRGVDGSAIKAQLPLVEAMVRLIGQIFALERQRADAQTGLPDRAEFERSLSRLLKLAQAEQATLTIFLLAREQTAEKPARLGPVVDRLQSSLRDSDQLYRYAMNEFALIALGLDEDGFELLGSKLQRRLATEGEGSASHCPWSVAGIRFQPGELALTSTLEASLAAETVLRQCQGIGTAEPLLLLNGADLYGNVDPQLSSIFSGETTRDYRHMRLLWDTIRWIGESASADALARDMVQLFAERLNAAVSLIQCTGNGANVLASTGEFTNPVPESLWQTLRQADSGPQLAAISMGGDAHHTFHSRETTLGSLHLLVSDSTPLIDESALQLLAGLNEQLSFALERLTITEQELTLRTREATALRQQVQALDATPNRHQLTFQSAAMQDADTRARRWAGTDEIVLITGESGCGKEVFAHRIHQQSNRAQAPMVTVDCASIPPTLIEAELFGRIKGAYTGADSAADGYVRKAAGGTLFLDEIGELPLDSQSKLLRLLQERQVSPVGSTDVYTVDVRIIAATNRSLSKEVDAGRFRADLMYRLQVLELELPPLRERAADIEPLCEHFLAQYNVQYERRCALSAEARTALVQYSWPGNVRELKHSMLKACLQAADDVITAADIGFSETQARPGPQVAIAANDISASVSANTAAEATGALSDEDVRQSLADALHTSCSAAIQERLKIPIGDWLSNAVIEYAYQQHGDIAKHAARAVGLPESTFRRQHDRLRTLQATGMDQVHPLFHNVLPWIRMLVQQGAQDTALLDELKSCLLTIVAALLPNDPGFAAALMGVTPPTYRRHLKELTAAGAPS